MKSKQTTRARVARVPSSSYNLSDEKTRAHRAINWVFSVVLVAFALWSILLNAQGRSLLKQSVASSLETDNKIVEIKQALTDIKNACQSPTIVIPTATVDTQADN